MTRRPSTSQCSCCGGRLSLARCGVDAHLRPRSRREQAEGRCPGRVYIHEANGGIDCPA